MSSLTPKILVVGAGPAGLIAALTLLQNGVPVRIIAKEGAYRIGHRGAGISPRSLEVYKFLGVEEVLQKSVYLSDMLHHAPGVMDAGAVVRMVPWLDPTPSYPWRVNGTMRQETAERILRSHLAKYGCEVELGTSLSTFEQHPNYVKANLVKSFDGRENIETTNFDWIIGADGARSVTRKGLGLTFLGESRDNEHFVIGDIQIEGLSTTNWHCWGTRGIKWLALIPGEKYDSGAFQIFAFGSELDYAKLSSSNTDLIAFLVEQTGLPKEAFKKIDSVAEYKPNIRMVNKFGEGRVFVVGDAAHIHSPIGGQGMNSSIQDAFNLAWKLALVAKSLSPPELLSSYNSERLPVIAEMLNITTVVHNKSQDPNSENPWARGGKLLQLGVNYRGSSIVVDETEKGEGNIQSDPYSVDGFLRGGDRAPDAPQLFDVRAANGTITRFFDIFKSYLHTVLIFSCGAPIEQSTTILGALQKYPEDSTHSAIVHHWGASPPGNVGIELATFVLMDRAGHAYAGYAVEPCSEQVTVFIIRPDGVIGGLVHGVEGVKRYFSGIFQ